MHKKYMENIQIITETNFYIDSISLTRYNI